MCVQYEEGTQTPPRKSLFSKPDSRRGKPRMLWFEVVKDDLIKYARRRKATDKDE